MTRYRWMCGQDRRRKAHAVAWSEWCQPTLCGNFGLGPLKPAGMAPRCQRCVAIAKRLKVRVTP